MRASLTATFISLLLTIPLPQANAASGPECFGRRPTIAGTQDKDVIVGTPGPDVIVGFDGRDEIHGKGGNDRICGGELGDQITGGGGDDRIKAGMGLDRIRGSSGDDRLIIDGSADIDLDHYEYAFGGPGDDELISDYSPGWLVGGDGADTLRTGQNSYTYGAGQNGYSDYLDGGDGADRLLVEVSGECETTGILLGGAGNDYFSDPYGCSFVSYEHASEAVAVNLEEGTATGEGTDAIDMVRPYVVGSDFADTMTGSTGNDGFSGGPGDDFLDGGLGIDDLDGDAGHDTCRNGERIEDCEGV